MSISFEKMKSVRKTLPPLRIHTNIPSPYRKHQFERLAQVFSDAKFYFYTEMDADRPWNDNLELWKISWCRMRRSINLGRFGKLSVDLLRELLKQPAGTVHLVGCGVSILDWCVLCLLGFLRLAVIIDFNDAGFPDKVTEKTKKRWKYVFSWGCWRAYTPGKLGREFGIAHGLEEHNIYNSYFSHDVEAFRQYYNLNYTVKREDVRRLNGISDQKRVILTISRYLDWKRLEDAAEAIYLLERECPDLAANLVYVLIGEGAWESHIRILDRLEKINVILLKQMPYDEVVKWYCAADLFLLPSEGDIWGLVVNEALSMHVPVICTERIGAAELIKDGVNGYRVPVRSPQMICARMMDCLSDGDRLKDMKNDAGLIVEEWNTEKGIQELVRLCKNS